MNVEPVASDAGLVSTGGNTPETASERLHDAVHALAQPLTALSFLLELARMQPAPEGIHNALKDAVVECQRAFHAMETVRAAMHEVDSQGEWRQ